MGPNLPRCLGGAQDEGHFSVTAGSHLPQGRACKAVLRQRTHIRELRKDDRNAAPENVDGLRYAGVQSLHFSTSLYFMEFYFHYLLFILNK